MTDRDVEDNEQAGGNDNAEEAREAVQRQAAEAEQATGVVEGPRMLGEVKLPTKPRVYFQFIRQFHAPYTFVQSVNIQKHLVR